MICQQCNGVYYSSGPKQDRRMNRKEKQIQNCGCISGTTINTDYNKGQNVVSRPQMKNKRVRKVSKEYEGH